MKNNMCFGHSKMFWQILVKTQDSASMNFRIIVFTFKDVLWSFICFFICSLNLKFFFKESKSGFWTLDKIFNGSWQFLWEFFFDEFDK